MTILRSSENREEEGQTYVPNQTDGHLERQVAMCGSERNDEREGESTPSYISGIFNLQPRLPMVRSSSKVNCARC